MSTLRTARRALKNSRNTTDAWFVRIERKDNKVVRFTNAVENITISSRHKGDGNTEALATPVTYYSTSGYNPTAVGSSDGMQPGTMDLEGILNAISASGETIAESITLDPSEASLRALTTDLGGSPVSSLFDGDNLTYWSPLAPVPDNTDAALEHVEVDFKIPAIFNKIRVYVDQTCYIGVKKSDDGMRFDEILPLVEKAPTGVSPNAYFDLTLPYTPKTRFIRLVLGQQTTGLPSSPLKMRTVEFIRETTKETSGTLTRADIELGLYANAKVKVFLTDYSDPYEDDERLFAGFLGSITLYTGTYVAELVSMQSMLSHPTGRRILPVCDTPFGSFRCGIHLAPPQWNSKIFAKPGETTDRAKGTWVVPTVENGLYYWADTEGHVGGIEPTWNTTIGGNTVDGSTNWVGVRAYVINSSIDGYSKSGYQLTINDVGSDPNGTWDNGKIEFLDGSLKGVVVTIATQIGNLLTLAEPLKTDPSVSDLIKITMGCKKRFHEDCLARLGNSKNFQGFPNVPGGKIASMRFVQEGG